jgi:trimeric autotransporter adhesin
MSTKTLRKRIALVAVSAMGFGLLSVVPASAALTATATGTFAIAGTTTAVTANAGALNAAAEAGADDIYVRSGASTQTFKLGMGSLTDNDVVFISMTSGTAAPTAAAQQVNLNCASVAGTETIDNTAGDMDVDGAGAIVASVDTGCAVDVDGTAIVDLVFTTSTLAAGNYSVWASETTSQAATTYKLADVVSYDVGAPVTLAYNVDGRTQVGAAVNTTVSSRVTDSTGRQTFLVGDETISHSWTYPVTTPASVAPQAVGSTTAASTPVYTSAGASFARYSTALDVTTGTLTVGTVYTLTGVILSGVNAFGNDTMTYVNVATTNGLAGTLALTSASTGAAITSIALANGQATTAANYVLTAKDAAGRVILGVTPVLTASAGTVTTAVGTTVDAGTDSTFVYTAPATGTSATLTFTMFGGSAGNTTLSIPVSLGATYGTADFGANMEVTANGGRLETSDVSDFDLSNSSAYGVTLDPSNTTSISVAFNLQDVVAGAFDGAVSGANLTVALGGSLPTAQRTLAASAVTTDALGTATATIAVNTARTGENLTVTFSSGTASLGVATITFTAAATTIAEIVAGPANAITQQAGTATAITATATDQYGQAAGNKRIQLTIVGPSAPVGGTTVVVTNASGVASYTVAGTTSVTGQTDTITVTQFEGSGVTAGANDIIAISYVATAPVVATFGIAGALTQNATASAATYTTYSTATLATAIEVANNGATAKAGAKFEDKAILPIDTRGDYTDTATLSGADAAPQDEVVGLRFRALNASSVALAGIPLVVTASTGAWMVGSLGTAVSTRTLYTDASGYIYVNAFATATGVATWTVTQGEVSASISVTYANDVEDSRFVSVSPATKSVTSGTLAQFVATVTDRYGNVVPGATVTWSELGAGRLEANSGATSATGTSTADFSTYATETGPGVVKAVIAYQGEDLASNVAALTAASNFTNGVSGIAAAAAGIASSSAAITVDAPTTKSAELLASEANAAAIAAIAAKAASDKAETDAKIKLLEAQIAAAQAASVAAAEAAADAAAEAIDAGNNAFDAATSAGEAADAATAAAEQAGEDATAAANAAGEAAVAAAEAAQEAAAEATDAANAATDAANASAEAADAATAAAQDAADAVAALSTQVSEMVSALKKQITALTNLVIKIQKKVKA